MTVLTHSAAAELLRGYAPPGMSLEGCLQRALTATSHDPVRRARVTTAAHVLKIGGPT